VFVHADDIKPHEKPLTLLLTKQFILFRDTTFSEKILDFYKIFEESEQFFILFLAKENGKSEAVFQHF
jgi:hypothetical protein